MTSIPIFTVEGQSNADGTFDVASITDIPTRTDYAQPYSAVQMMELRSGGPVTPQTWDLDRGPTSLSPRPGGTLGLFGVELAFGRALTNAGITHAISKCSVRGASLAVDLALNSSFDTQCVARRATAATQLGGYMAGCLWIQGEADANNSGFAAAYYTNLYNRIVRDRQLHGDGFWYVINRMNTRNLGPYQDNVRDAEDRIAATLPRVRIFECSDLPLSGAHFTSDSMVTLGTRFANEVLAVWTPRVVTRRRHKMLAIKTSHPCAEERRVYFTAVSSSNLQTRLTGLAPSAFTCKLHKPGQTGASTTANLPAEVDSTNQPGVYSLLHTTTESDTAGFGTLRISASGMEPREIPIYFEQATFGAVASGTLTATSFTTTLSDTTTNQHKDALIRMLDGACAGQIKKVGAYDGVSKTITLATIAGIPQSLTSAPSPGDNFEILTR